MFACAAWSLLNQVDGCVEDLSGLKRYFQRYHVCEQHMRAPVVLIAGRQVRFCDQCSTFHPLNFFDGVRRCVLRWLSSAACMCARPPAANWR